MKILVTGGCGYKGSVLVPQLIEDGHEVTVVDAMWFGNHLPPDIDANVVEEDTRNTSAMPVKGMDAVIHLANIANDPGVELNPLLSWEVNVLATQQLAETAARAGVEHFLFASSGSVYGLKDEVHVTEDLELLPISAYNKTKMVAERVLLSYSGHMRIVNIRPATVCGISPRMRFDVTVNMFAKQAVLENRITIFGGDQIRPNIHINDVVDVYRHFLDNTNLPGGQYNAGFENLAIRDIAALVQDRTGCEILTTPSNDPRSYRQNSDKLLATGFKPKKTVLHAVDEIIEAFANGFLQDRDDCYTVRWMSKVVLDPGFPDG